MESEKRLFYCPDCHLEFEDIGYVNPVFLADKVANCPKCGGKCWEKTVNITYSQYKEYMRFKEGKDAN